MAQATKITRQQLLDKVGELAKQGQWTDALEMLHSNTTKLTGRIVYTQDIAMTTLYDENMPCPWLRYGDDAPCTSHAGHTGNCTYASEDQPPF